MASTGKSTSGKDLMIDPPKKCSGCKMDMEIMMSKQDIVFLPTALHGLVLFVCPECGATTANANGYANVIGQMKPESKIIRLGGN
jgi:hypothetical protein